MTSRDITKKDIFEMTRISGRAIAWSLFSFLPIFIALVVLINVGIVTILVAFVVVLIILRICFKKIAISKFLKILLLAQLFRKAATSRTEAKSNIQSFMKSKSIGDDDYERKQAADAFMTIALAIALLPGVIYLIISFIQSTL